MKNIQTATAIKELPQKFTAKKITVYNSIMLAATVIIFSLLFACQKESYSPVTSNENAGEHAETMGLRQFPMFPAE
jgi:hypothetical protein